MTGTFSVVSMCRRSLLTAVTLVYFTLAGTSRARILEDLPLPLDEEDCMSIQQLEAAVDLAAWDTVVGSIPRSGVILTSCDTQCLKTLFEPFIWALEHSRDGDISQHVIVVSHGKDAYLHCDSLRKSHRHHCIQDNWCMPGAQPEPGAKIADHMQRYMAIMQKAAWAAEIVKLGKSVMWTDMDVTYFSNPLKFLFEAAPSADVILSSEDWGGRYSFKGDVCKYPDAARQEAVCSQGEGLPLEGMCCHTRVDGGVWLVNPEERGASFLQTWLALLFEELVVKGKMWSGDIQMDQSEMLGDMVVAAKFRQADSSDDFMKATLFKRDSNESFVRYGEVVRSADEQIYMMSPMRMNSMCGGQCGFRWDAVSSGRWHEDLGVWRGDGYAYSWVGEQAGGYTMGADNQIPPRQLVCHMPQEFADKMVGFHHSCILGGRAMAMQQVNMLAWRNWTTHDCDNQCTVLSREACVDRVARMQPPIYIITAITQQQTLKHLHRLYASMQFNLVRQWIVVHDTNASHFKPALEHEKQVLDLLYGQIKILEIMLDQPSGEQARQWNRGLDAIEGDGLVYFVSSNNIMHPNFWSLAATQMSPGHIYTFEQQLAASASSGQTSHHEHRDEAGQQHVALSQFVADKAIIGGHRFASEDKSGHGMVSDLISQYAGKHVNLHKVAAFRDLGHSDIMSLKSLVDQQADALTRAFLQDTPAAPAVACQHALPPIYIISPFTRTHPAEYLRRLYASMQFQLITQWILVHDDAEKDFRPALEAESKTLEVIYGKVKILEVAYRQDGSVTGHAQRNKGLDLITGDGVVYFVDGDNALHPNFWVLAATQFSLGHLYTFDQWRDPPDAQISVGDTLVPWHIDTAMFAIDRRLIGDTRFEVTMYDADGIFVQTVHQLHKSAHVHLKAIATFYNYSKRKYLSLFPTMAPQDWSVLNH